MPNGERKGFGYLPGTHVYDYLRDVEGDQDYQAKTGSFRNGRYYLHTDPSGSSAIGFGHNLSRDELRSGRFRNGLSPKEADSLLREDVKKATE
ncbi:MAG: hypothetical protein ACXAD7_25505, partial [Candidatus Kariarchaeaceae archaeon]